MYFWPAAREALTDGGDLANRAQAQEHEAKAVLDQLDKLAPEDAEFEALLAQCHEMLTKLSGTEQAGPAAVSRRA
jgi:hypothetical protein